jgi:hypothetical protein
VSNGVNINMLNDNEEAKRHMYPPHNTVVPRFSMKSDAKGLGFAAHLLQPLLLPSPHHHHIIAIGVYTY